MPIPCASPKFITLPSFICGFTPVSEIREFNQKKKKEEKMMNSEKGFFLNLTQSKRTHFLTNHTFDGIVTPM